MTVQIGIELFKPKMILLVDDSIFLFSKNLS